jgi:Ca2+/Na+ antiporter
MKPKIVIKVIVDVVMTAMILAQMAYHITDNQVHEWMGAALFVLFILHHVLNWR